MGVYLGYSPASVADENDFTDVAAAIWRHSAVRLSVTLGRDLDPAHQLLVVFGVRKIHVPGPAAVQVFAGSEWVRSDQINHENETIAILLDAPPLESTTNVSDSFYPSFYAYVLYLRLASDVPECVVALTGIHGYVL